MPSAPIPLPITLQLFLNSAVFFQKTLKNTIYLELVVIRPTSGTLIKSQSKKSVSYL